MDFAFLHSAIALSLLYIPPMSDFLEIVLPALPLLLKGAGVTIQLTVFSIALGLVGGSLLGIARLSKYKIVRVLTRIYVDFFRGTPLLVQLFMIYFGLPGLLNSMGLPTFDKWWAAIAALSLNSAAYISEIIRAGIQSIPPGQTEASESLGLSPFETMRYVVFPQAFRVIIPPLGNEFIIMLKDTSLAAVIGYQELFQEGKLIVASNYRAFEIYTAVALVYLVLTLISSQFFSRLEIWMDPVKRRQQKAQRA